jgi:hypothetical protein
MERKKIFFHWIFLDHKPDTDQQIEKTIGKKKRNPKDSFQLDVSQQSWKNYF